MEARSLQEAPVEHYQLSIRIRHPSMDPAELSQAFNIQPEYCFRAGEARSSSSNWATGAVHSESYWLGVLKPSAYLSDLAFFFDHRSPSIAQKQFTAALKSLSWALSVATSRFLSRHTTLL